MNLFNQCLAPYLSRSLTGTMIVAATFVATFTLTATVFAAPPPKANDIQCDIGLAEIDKNASLGLGGESQELTISASYEKGNYSGTGTVAFKTRPYKVSVLITVGDADLANTWSSIVVTLYKVTAGKNQLVGSVMIPNTYYSPGSIAPQEFYVGHNETLQKVANEPGVLDFANWDFSKLLPLFKNGDVVGAMVTCSPK